MATADTPKAGVAGVTADARSTLRSTSWANTELWQDVAALVDRGVREHRRSHASVLMHNRRRLCGSEARILDKNRRRVLRVTATPATQYTVTSLREGWEEESLVGEDLVVHCCQNCLSSDSRVRNASWNAMSLLTRCNATSPCCIVRA